jgi:hypothetical protein
MRKTSIACLMVLGLVLPAWGGPLAKEQVAASANWVVHLDVDQFNQSKLGQMIRAEATEKGIDAQLLEFKQTFSFHPLDDVRNITLYGQGEDKTKVAVIVQGNYDKQTLLGLVQLNANYQEIRAGNLVIHSWIDDKQNERAYGTFYDVDQVIIAGSVDAVKLAAAVLNGQEKSAKAEGSFSLPATKGPGAILLAAARDVSSMANHKNALILKQTDELTLVIGEANEKFYIDADLKAKTPEAAVAVGQMAQGLIAVGVLAGRNHPELAQLAASIGISVENNLVQVSFQMESEKIITAMKKAWDREQQKQNQTAP